MPEAPRLKMPESRKPLIPEVRAKVEKWTRKGREWWERLWREAEEKPREVIVEVAKVQKQKSVLLVEKPRLREGIPPSTVPPSREVKDDRQEIMAPKPEEYLVERPITIPPNLEVIEGPNAGQAGRVYIDRANKRAYRVADLTRFPSEVEDTKRDFSNKIEVAKKDTTGLTPPDIRL